MQKHADVLDASAERAVTTRPTGGGACFGHERLTMAGDHYRYFVLCKKVAPNISLFRQLKFTSILSTLTLAAG